MYISRENPAQGVFTRPRTTKLPFLHTAMSLIASKFLFTHSYVTNSKTSKFLQKKNYCPFQR